MLSETLIITLIPTISILITLTARPAETSPALLPPERLDVVQINVARVPTQPSQARGLGRLPGRLELPIERYQLSHLPGGHKLK